MSSSSLSDIFFNACEKAEITLPKTVDPKYVPSLLNTKTSQGRNYFCHLIAKGALTPDDIKICLAAGAKIEHTDLLRDNALSLALKTGQDDVFATLLTYGGKDHVNNLNRMDGCNLIHLCVMYDREQWIGPLTRMGVDINGLDHNAHTPLLRAVRERKLSIVKTLLKHGADTAKFEKFSGLSLIDALAQNSTSLPNSPLEIKILTALLNAGAHPAPSLNHIQKMPPLMVYIQRQNTEAIQLLLKAGADPYQRDLFGENALQLAARKETWDSVRLMVENGADLNFAGPGRGLTPLMTAVYYKKSLSFVTKLIENGADVNQPSGPYHKTALHAAAEENLLDLTQLLLRFGADPLIRDDNNDRPLEAARQKISENSGVLTRLELATAYAEMQQNKKIKQKGIQP